jgi:hypothetical protein
MTVNCDSRLVIRMSLQMRNSLTQTAEAGLVARAPTGIFYFSLWVFLVARQILTVPPQRDCPTRTARIPTNHQKMPKQARISGLVLQGLLDLISPRIAVTS